MPYSSALSRYHCTIRQPLFLWKKYIFLIFFKKAIIDDWLFCAWKKNLRIFGWKLKKKIWTTIDRNAKNHDRGGFLKLFLYSTNFKYMISIWNFFFEMCKSFLLPFSFLHPGIKIKLKNHDFPAFSEYYDVQWNKNYKSI